MILLCFPENGRGAPIMGGAMPKKHVTATLCDRGNTAAAIELLVAADFGDPTAAVANVT